MVHQTQRSPTLNESDRNGFDELSSAELVFGLLIVVVLMSSIVRGSHEPR